MNDLPLPRPPAQETALDPIREYFLTLKEILTQPRVFFRKMKLIGGFSGPLAFALVTHWVGRGMEFLWSTLVGGAAIGFYDRLLQFGDQQSSIDYPGGRPDWLLETKSILTNWFLGAGSVIIDPFFSLIKILFYSFLIYFVCLFLIPRDRIFPKGLPNFEVSLRIVCYASAAQIFLVLPFVGPLLGWGVTLFITAVGLSEIYSTSFSRGLVIAFFPKLLPLVFAGLFFSFFIAIAAFFIGAFASGW